MWYIISLFMIFSCQKKTTSIISNQTKNEMIFNCLIYPTGNLSETYLIEVFEDGNMKTTFGEFYDNKNFSKIKRIETIKLSDSNLQIFLNLKKEIIKGNEIKRDKIRKGGWEIIFRTDNKIYHFYYGNISNKSLSEIIELIKKLSPVKLNIHSWS